MHHIKLIFPLLLLLLLATGCVADDLPEQGGENGVKPGAPLTLTFTIGVPSMGADGAGGERATRAIYYGNPVYYEDWIDTQDGLRVLFFLSRREKNGVAGAYEDDNNFVAVDPKNPLKDYFLFESTSRWVTQLPYDEDNNLRYQVTVPVYQIGDEEAQYRPHWERIRELLRTYDFKVAIMANHPQKNINWTVANSVLSAPDIDDLSTAKNLKTINDIHHSVSDNNYANGSSGRKEGYDIVVDSKNTIDGMGTMGPFIDWVISRANLYGDALGGVFDTRESARVWLRDYWRPALKWNENDEEDYEMLYHDYRNVWLYWNFGGAAADNGLPYSEKSKINTHIGEWEQRNGALLRGVITDAAGKNGGKLPEINTGPSGNSRNDASMPLTLHPSGATASITPGSNGKRFYGVTLPKISAPSTESDKDCFQFTMLTKGTITVTYIANGGTVAVKGTNVSSTANSTKTVNGVKLNVVEYYHGVNDTHPCFVYSSAGSPTILDIEFTEDEYIYLTDREGILPSSDHPIPMYGVQKFDRLEGFWDDGASFDLTAGGTSTAGETYRAKTISLLRAVAKIEVLIPKSLGVPRHVYMRSLNRNVRCEPMDVATPTDQLWKDHDTECEWRMIQQRGTMYVDGKYSEADYKKKLAWYYGNWMEWGWNFNGKTTYAPSQSDGPFPRIMNPYINRSDFAAFIDVTDYYNDQYYHFLFYMGENTLDAPSQYNGNGGSYMVPHVEIRFDERYAASSKMATNTTFNLDDGDCYRIYFTEGGIAKGARDANGVSTIAKGSYSTKYENNASYLKEHWPIMRNHVYRFTVRDVSSDNMNGLVVDAQNRSVDFNFK